MKKLLGIIFMLFVGFTLVACEVEEAKPTPEDGIQDVIPEEDKEPEIDEEDKEPEIDEEDKEPEIDEEDKEPEPEPEADPEDEVEPEPEVDPEVNIPKLMIYEIYGGGGNTGAIYTYDYVVLYNDSNVDVELDGYSLHYASATGDFKVQEGLNYEAVTFLTGTIKAKQFFVIQMAKGTNEFQDLPVIDQVANIGLAGTNGKIALANNIDGTESLTGIEDERIIDFVGFGSANMYEGTGATKVLSNKTSAKRKDFIDTNDNSVDFEIVTPDLAYVLNTR